MTPVTQALALWGLAEAEAKLIAARENAVYRVEAPGGRVALRLHRKGYRTDSELSAELDWMAWLDGSAVAVPRPVPSRAGPYLQSVDGIQVDVLTWLDGQTLDQALADQHPAQHQALFQRLGEKMAQLHAASDRWPGAAACDRPKWDVDGLLGEAPLWDRFWENPALRPDEATLLRAFRSKAQAQLSRLSQTLDAGLIHADLVPGNVICTDTALYLIDFDDGGFGFRLFELATALVKHLPNPASPSLQSAMIAGYRRVRPIDTTHLPLFLALRAATYVGWNISRSHEDPAQARNARFISQATALAARYLEGH